MDAWAGIAALAAATVIFVVVMLVAANRRAARSTDTMVAMGAMLGMSHQQRDATVPWMAFRSLRHYGAFANVLDGETNGRRIASAHAVPIRGAGDAAAIAMGTSLTVTGGAGGIGGIGIEGAAEPVAQRSVAMAFTEPVPPLVVVRRGPMHSLADRLFSTSVDLELEAFNRAFYVRADDPKDAYAVLQPQVMEWLLMTDDRLSFETGAAGVLVFAPLLAPDQTPMLVATAASLAERIPRSATLS